MLDLKAALAVWLRGRHIPFGRALATLMLWRAGRIAGVRLRGPRLVDLAPRVSCPTLIVQGTEDSLFPAAEVRSLASRFVAPALLIEVPGARHSDVIAVGGEPLRARILAFLNDNSRKASEPAQVADSGFADA
jgi:pimeloyl-ACP methyl ester carboxylesterase